MCLSENATSSLKVLEMLNIFGANQKQIFLFFICLKKRQHIQPNDTQLNGTQHNNRKMQWYNVSITLLKCSTQYNDVIYLVLLCLVSFR